MVVNGWYPTSDAIDGGTLFIGKCFEYTAKRLQLENYRVMPGARFTGTLLNPKRVVKVVNVTNDEILFVTDIVARHIEALSETQSDLK